MKKLSNLVNENNSLMTYKYTASIDIDGVVDAHSEGDAGELIDKHIDEISSITSVTGYTIHDISKIKKQIQENSINNDDMNTNIKLIENEIIELYNNKVESLTPYYRAMLTNNLAHFFGKL